MARLLPTPRAVAPSPPASPWYQAFTRLSVQRRRAHYLSEFGHPLTLADADWAFASDCLPPVRLTP